MARKKQIIEEESIKSEEEAVVNTEPIPLPVVKKKYMVIMVNEKALILKDENENGFYIPITKQNKNSKVGDILYLDIFKED